MTSTEKKLIESALAVLSGADIGTPDSSPCHLVLSFSGGPDSAALLDCLCLSKPVNLTLSLFYLNHHLRSEGECAAEESFVRETAERYRLPVVMEAAGRGELAALAKQTGTSCEDAARMERYRRFLKTLERYPEPVFGATAHHNDDHLETLIIRFFQGSGPSGLTGIAENNGRILRPLRNVSREDILAYNKERDVRFVMDESNNDGKYLRNRVRHELIPEIRRIFPGYRTALNRMAGQNQRQENTLAAGLPTWREEDTDRDQPLSLILPLPLFGNCPADTRYRLLMTGADRLLKNRVKPGYRIPSRFFGPLTEGVFCPERGYAACGHGLVVSINESKGNGLIRLSVATGQEPGGFFYRLEKGRTVIVHDWIINVSGETDLDGDALFRFCLPEPAVCRSWLPGDVIRLRGHEHRLKKLFGEWSVPGDKREMIPVFEGPEGVCALAAKPFGGENCCSDTIICPKYGDFSKPFLYIVMKRTGGSLSSYA